MIVVENSLRKQVSKGVGDWAQGEKEEDWGESVLPSPSPSPPFFAPATQAKLKVVSETAFYFFRNQLNGRHLFKRNQYSSSL